MSLWVPRISSTPGHFAHIARTDSGVQFQNVTIELVHPQGTPKNLCKEVLPGAPLNCPEAPAAAVENGKGKKGQPEPKATAEDVPCFETDEIRADLHKVSSGNDYVDARRIVDFLGTRSSFLLISFKDSAPAPATQ